MDGVIEQNPAYLVTDIILRKGGLWYTRNMKTCRDCGISKNHTEFYKYRHGDRITLYARCKACMKEKLKKEVPQNVKSERRRNHRAKVQEVLNKLKAVPCADCEIEYPPYIMDFDHVGDGKFMNISRMAGRYSTVKVLEEVKKCEVVCANCHRQRTHDRKHASVV